MHAGQCPDAAAPSHTLYMASITSVSVSNKAPLIILLHSLIVLSHQMPGIHGSIGLCQLWCMRMGGLVPGIYGWLNGLMSVMVYENGRLIA